MRISTKISLAIVGIIMFAFTAMAFTVPKTTVGKLKAGGSTVLTAAAAVAIPKKEDGTEFDEDEQEMLKAFIKLQDESNKGMATEEKFEAFIKSIGAKVKETDEFKELESRLKKREEENITQGELINELKESGTGSKVHKTIMEQIHEALEANKDNIESWKKNEKKVQFIITKAPTTMTTSNTVTGTGAAQAFNPGLEPGINDDPRPDSVVMGYANTMSTDRKPLYWMDKANEEGNAAFTAEGTLKPLRSWDVEMHSSEPKKIAVVEKATEEVLNDIEGMADLIYTDIMQEIEDITDEQLLNGDGVGANPTGLLSQVGGYVLTSITGVPNANNADALRAAYAQLRSLNYRPNIIFVNPIDAGKMDLEKGTNGHYVLPLFMSQDGTTLKSIRIEETNEIEPGDFLMGDMSRYKIRIYEELRIELGWVNDDFQKNVKTVIGEKRLYNFLSQKHSGAFVHDTYAVVKTAIA